MGLAKSAEAPVVEKTPSVTIETPPGLSSYEWQGIPIDVIRHFNVELGTIPAKDLEQLKDITSWAKSRTSEEPSIGNILQEISKIQRELGAPRQNEKAYEKTWQFIKAQRVIDEMRKRQEALRTTPWI